MNMASKFKVFLEMIKFEHTIFALPFAYLGAFLAAGGFPTLLQFLWISLAMASARTAAMSLNRIIDRHLDALNPRTKERALPKGLLSVFEVWIYTILSLVLLYIAASNLNSLCVKLMPLAVFILVIYSYTKRWTWACHLILGIADGLAPVGAWVAVTGSLDYPGILLGLGMAVWVAGFDIIYACQDVEFDRKNGIFSIPSCFGLEKSLQFARLFHVISVILLMSVGIILHMNFWYWTGIVIAALILIYEHRLVKPKDLSKIGVAFLNMNGYLSVIVFIFTVIAIFF